MSEETNGFTDSSNLNIGSIQEGAEWVAKLQEEADNIIFDLERFESELTSSSKVALQFTYQQTVQTIDGVKMEMMLFDK